jgi:hypothetical protein
MPKPRPPTAAGCPQEGLNLTRLAIASLFAGLIMNSGEFLLNGVFMAEEWDTTMRSLNRSPIGGASVVWLASMTFLLGFFAIGTYLIIRPHFGAGLRTAIIAALILWALAYALGFGWSFAMGVFSAKIFFATLGWTLFEIPLATAIGAWYYENSSASSARPHP